MASKGNLKLRTKFKVINICLFSLDNNSDSAGGEAENTPSGSMTVQGLKQYLLEKFSSLNLNDTDTDKNKVKV